MDSELLERLLYEDESATLDFKREQYKFVKASDDEKSELLKDILGFANAWRRSDAYILIGVEEVRGDRSKIIGISDHLDDHALQQFVNSQTNRPIQFGYHVHAIDGTQIGVIRIEQQVRPIYLKRDYGRLERDKVYVRRGSSTNPGLPATLDEIAQMGAATNSMSSEAELSIAFAEATHDEALGSRIRWVAEFCAVPAVKDIPTYPRSTSRNAFGLSHELLEAFRPDEVLNKRFYKDVAEYEFVKRQFQPVRLVVTNLGKVAANDVRVEVNLRDDEGITLADSVELPDPPKRYKSRYSFPVMKHIRPNVRSVGSVEITSGNERFKLEIDCGNVQPGRRIWSEAFYVAIKRSGEFQLPGQLFAENLPNPKAFQLIIEAEITNTALTVDELIARATVYSK